jgi:hypothetical protein
MLSTPTTDTEKLIQITVFKLDSRSPLCPNGASKTQSKPQWPTATVAVIVRSKVPHAHPPFLSSLEQLPPPHT